MKPFDELERDELVALSGVQIEHYIDISCAEEGVPLLPPKPVEPEPMETQPDVSAYALKVGFSTELFFSNLIEAEGIRDVLMNAPILDTAHLGNRYDGRYMTLKPSESEYIVEKKQFWSQEAYQSNAIKLEQYAERKKIFADDDRAYNDALSRRNNVAKSILDSIERANTEMREEARIREQLVSYIELANGDRDMALVFFCKAYPGHDAADLVELLPPTNQTLSEQNSQSKVA